MKITMQSARPQIQNKEMTERHCHVETKTLKARRFSDCGGPGTSKGVLITISNVKKTCTKS